jgi:hypothetical protein
MDGRSDSDIPASRRYAKIYLDEWSKGLSTTPVHCSRFLYIILALLLCKNGVVHIRCNFVTSGTRMEPILTSTHITVNGRPECASPVTFALLPSHLCVNEAFTLPQISQVFTQKLDHRSFFLDVLYKRRSNSKSVTVLLLLTSQCKPTGRAIAQAVSRRLPNHGGPGKVM